MACLGVQLDAALKSGMQPSDVRTNPQAEDRCVCLPAPSCAYPMDAFYNEIRIVHITAVLTSGGLFALRGVAINGFGALWPMWASFRYFSYVVDTVLLVAALTLVVITRQYPFLDAWLTAKVLLVIGYIVLGSFALKRGKSRSTRWMFFAAALAVFGFIITIARTHDPFGFFGGNYVFP